MAEHAQQFVLPAKNGTDSIQALKEELRAKLEESRNIWELHAAVDAGELEPSEAVDIELGREESSFSGTVKTIIGRIFSSGKKHSIPRVCP